MIDTGLNLNAYACKDIRREVSEMQRYSPAATEVWKLKIFSDAWYAVDDSELLGSQHDIRYASSFEALKEDLEIENPAPIGFSFYMTYSYLRGQYGRGEHNRVYRARHPLVVDADVHEVLATAEKEKIVYLTEDIAKDLFKEIVGEDLEHVNSISESCILSPKKSLRGLLSVVYSPKRANTMRGRRKGEKKRARELKEAHERKQAKIAAFDGREKKREELSNKRRTFLIAISRAIFSSLDKRISCWGVVNFDFISSDSGEQEFVSYILKFLTFVDHLKVGADEYLDPCSNVFQATRKRCPTSFKGVGRALGRLISNLPEHLGAYRCLRKNRELFPRNSGILAEPDYDTSIKTPDEDSLVADYRELYMRLQKIVAKIKAGRRFKRIKKGRAA